MNLLTMDFTLGNYQFSYPCYLPPDDDFKIENRSGVYAIVGYRDYVNQPDIIDIGESKTIRNRIINHERRPCWESYKNEYLKICVAVFYTKEKRREQIEEELLIQYKPPCVKQHS